MFLSLLRLNIYDFILKVVAIVFFYFVTELSLLFVRAAVGTYLFLGYQQIYIFK